MQFPDFEDEIAKDEITFDSEDIDFSLENEGQIADWLRSVIEAEGKELLELSYIFCSDAYLLQVNIDYLQHDYYTDIITFQLTEGVVHGDLFISIDRVQDNAKQLNTTFELELARVMVHGVLHLAGYGDKSPEQVANMRAKEDQYIHALYPRPVL